MVEVVCLICGLVGNGWPFTIGETNKHRVFNFRFNTKLKKMNEYGLAVLELEVDTV